MSLITLQNVVVREREKAVLDGLDLDIGAHEKITIIGPNGAGKTTLLRVILGLRKPDSGTITFARPVRFGYVPQKLPLNPLIPMQVEAFLKLGTGATPDALIRVMEEVGISHLSRQSIHVLSGGEMQRMLMARALLRNPEVLVLDEPAQNLDFSGQIQLYKLIDAIHAERQCAVILVSHDLHLVMRSSSKVICLFHHICCSGQPESIVGDKAFTQLFGENIADVLATYHHSHTHTHDPIPEKPHQHGEHCNHG